MTAGKLLAELAETLGARAELAAELARRGGGATDLTEELRAIRLEMSHLAGAPRSNSFPDGYLSVRQVAMYVSLKPATIREWCESVRLRASKAGTQWRIRT